MSYTGHSYNVPRLMAMNDARLQRRIRRGKASPVADPSHRVSFSFPTGQYSRHGSRSLSATAEVPVQDYDDIQDIPTLGSRFLDTVEDVVDNFVSIAALLPPAIKPLVSFIWWLLSRLLLLIMALSALAYISSSVLPDSSQELLSSHLIHNNTIAFVAPLSEHVLDHCRQLMNRWPFHISTENAEYLSTGLEIPVGHVFQSLHQDIKNLREPMRQLSGIVANLTSAQRDLGAARGILRRNGFEDGWQEHALLSQNLEPSIKCSDQIDSSVKTLLMDLKAKLSAIQMAYGSKPENEIRGLYKAYLKHMQRGLDEILCVADTCQRDLSSVDQSIDAMERGRVRELKYLNNQFGLWVFSVDPHQRRLLLDWLQHPCGFAHQEAHKIISELSSDLQTVKDQVDFLLPALDQPGGLRISGSLSADDLWTIQSGIPRIPFEAWNKRF